METKLRKRNSGLHLGNLLCAIEQAVKECERCPDDSTQDIWNEALESWQTGYRMNQRLEIVAEGN